MGRPRGYKMSEEHKKKIGLSNKGKPHPPLSEETRKKISESHKGRIGWWRGKHRFFSEQHKEKLRQAAKRVIAEGRHNLWRGGKMANYPELEQIRKSSEYKLWRTAVFERDNYTCIWCKQRGGKLNADHIKPFILYPELRFAIDNGRTLCIDCHRKIGWTLFRENNPQKRIK